MTHIYTLTTIASFSKITEIADFIEKSLLEEKIPQNIIFPIGLAVDEITNNIMMYAYENKEGTLSISLTVTHEEISIEILDHGKQFNPLSFPPPDLTQEAEKRRIGGLGIHLVRKVMDEVQYKHHDGQNILTIKKFVSNQKE